MADRYHDHYQIGNHLTIRHRTAAPSTSTAGRAQTSLTIRRDAIERSFFRELQNRVLTNDVIDYTIREFTRRIRECPAQTPNEIVEMKARKQEIEQELARLAAAIAHAGHSRFLVDAIHEREGELDQVAQRLKAAARGVVEQHPGNIREFVTTRLADLYGLLNVEVIRARAELAKHTTEIRMVPEAGVGGGSQYVAEGNWNFFGGADFVMVAGGRDERCIPFRFLATVAG